MTCPKVGCRVWIRDRALPTLRQLYPELNGEDTYTVVQIERRPREVVYLQAGDRLVPIWRSHCKPIPRCEYCNAEGHTKSRATKANCLAAREYAAVRAAEKL